MCELIELSKQIVFRILFGFWYIQQFMVIGFGQHFQLPCFAR